MSNQWTIPDLEGQQIDAPLDALKSEFEPVRKTKVYEDVVDQIQQRILDGRLKLGDKLPAERDLAEAFGVSRTSVRDAIRVLELMGLVEPRQGEGTVVCDSTSDSLVTPLATLLVRHGTLLADLLDVRKMIEPPLAARAAAHISPEEIAHLEQILRHQEHQIRGGELPIDADSEFHYTIATAAKNRVALKVVDVLMDLLRESRQRSLQVEGRLQKSVAGHRRILAAMRHRDPAAAEAAMRQHIVEIEAVLLKS